MMRPTTTPPSASFNVCGCACAQTGQAAQRTTHIIQLRACLKIWKGAVCAPQAGWRGATKENIPGGSSTEEQRSQPACGMQTLRAAVLLALAGVGSVLTARCGDARTSPPWPQPKSLAAAPFLIFRLALRAILARVIRQGRE